MTGLAAWDWAVLAAYLAGVSVLGVALAGRQKDMADFFRGGDGLPWWAVSMSLIATTVSAVTFVGVPAIAYNPDGGNMTYLQLGLVAGLIARAFVAFVLVPAYFRKRVYSPYDYMGDRLGGGARGVTTALFTLGGVLAQSARVYLTAMFLTVVLAGPLAWVESITGVSPLAASIVVVGVIAVVLTLLGGIATVVWTDALLMLVFIAGGVAALVVILTQLPGGVSEYVELGRANEKFEVFDFRGAFSLTEPYTLAAAGFAVVVGNLGSYGTDQLLAQRIFCCRNAADAKKAVMASYAGEAVTTLMLLVGVGLFAFYAAFPERLAGDAGALVEANRDNIFPVFIRDQMPAGVKGLVVAGVFAAAISSLTSILAALAQTTVSATYLPWRARRLGVAEPTAAALAGRDPAEARRVVLVARGWIVAWGVVLCVAAFAVDRFKDATGVPILDLALGLASYVVGGLFAAFLLAWLPVRVNGRGLVWAAPLGVLAVFACRFHEPWAVAACGVGVGGLVVTWVATLSRERLGKTAWLLVGGGLVMALAWRGYFVEVNEAGEAVRVPVAWPWYAPLGAAVSLTFGYLLADRKPRAA
ncbi:MAG: hypothetical protein AAF800_03275 [Planctomycetota bacterium]